jgi:CRP-like cAMP-binding protein
MTELITYRAMVIVVVAKVGLESGRHDPILNEIPGLRLRKIMTAGTIKRMWGSKPTQPVEKQYRAGEYIFRESDEPNALYLIKKGSVAIRKRKADGEIEIARIHSNEVIGELSFFDRAPRSASAVALTEVEALEISFKALEKIFEAVPPYFRTIMASVAERLRRAGDIIRKLDKDVIYEGIQGEATDSFTASDAIAAALEAEEKKDE